MVNQGYAVEQVCFDVPELQSIDPGRVAVEKLNIVKSLTNLRPLIVDDTGLEVPQLLGFPGALIKPILELGGLYLLRDVLSSRIVSQSINAQFITALAVSTTKCDFVVKGKMEGSLNFSDLHFLDSKECSGIFYPDGENRSLLTLKNSTGSSAFRHRFLAMDKLIEKLGEIDEL
jgi:inosine/xanthosine triphosphate pyrophosphatase family protein